jgi:hypothetical protein
MDYTYLSKQTYALNVTSCILFYTNDAVQIYVTQTFLIQLLEYLYNACIPIID